MADDTQIPMSTIEETECDISKDDMSSRDVEKADSEKKEVKDQGTDNPKEERVSVQPRYYDENSGLLVRLKDQYALRKNAAHHLIDVALLLANVSQLKTMVDLGPYHPHYNVLMGFIIFSICLQLAFAVIAIMIWSAREIGKYNTAGGSTGRNSNLHCVIPERIAELMDRICIIIVLMILVINMFITGFGLNPNARIEQTTANSSQ